MDQAPGQSDWADPSFQSLTSAPRTAEPEISPKANPWLREWINVSGAEEQAAP